MPIPGPLPGDVLLLDDGTGTFPTDISDYLDRGAGLSLSGFGRQQEFDQAQAASLTVTLKNNDGIFTTGALALSTGVKIRWQEKDSVGVTHDRFTGRISSVDLGWDGAPGFKADVTVTAVDVLADLTRRPMRSILEEEISLDSPSAFYPLTEEVGATSSGDISGHSKPPLKIKGSSNPFVFGAPIGPTTGVKFDDPSSPANAQYLAASRNGTTIIGTGAWTVECVFLTNATGVGAETILGLDAGSISGVTPLMAFEVGTTAAGVDFYGATTSSVLVGSTSIIDGQAHTIAATFDGVNTLKLYTDGVLQATTTTADPPAAPMTRLTIGNGFAGPLQSGTVSTVVLWDGVALSQTRLAAHATAVAVEETTTNRLARLASYVGLTTIVSGASGITMPLQATSGSSLFDAMQAVATAEDGILFVDGSGNLRMQGRSYRATKTVPDLTIGSGDPGVDTTPTLDTQQKINQVSVTRSGGAEQVVKAPAVLADPNEPVYDSSLDLIVDTDDDALDAANWIVAKHTTPGVRISTLTLDLLTSPNAADFLALQIGDRISLSGLPAQMFADATDYTIEGWSETRSVSDATLTLNLLPWSLFEALVLDDATSGLLDTGHLGH